MVRNLVFLDIFNRVQQRYEQLLAEAGDLDFHDFINRAAGHIGDRRWQTRYRYVLVDEFQDISAGRMALLRALNNTSVAYFVVGDDWQSIYRFAGSDVSLVSGCGNHLGHVQQRTLSLTFRYGDGILAPSTTFIKKNPQQTPEAAALQRHRQRQRRHRRHLGGHGQRCAGGSATHRRRRW